MRAASASSVAASSSAVSRSIASARACSSSRPERTYCTHGTSPARPRPAAGSRSCSSGRMTAPSSACISPVISRKMVDLPAPFGPTSPTRARVDGPLHAVKERAPAKVLCDVIDESCGVPCCRAWLASGESPRNPESRRPQRRARHRTGRDRGAAATLASSRAALHTVGMRPNKTTWAIALFAVCALLASRERRRAARDGAGVRCADRCGRRPRPRSSGRSARRSPTTPR